MGKRYKIYSFKVIHNVILTFIMIALKITGARNFESSFLTDKANIRGCYMTLECHYRDDFALIKKNYLKLAKECRLIMSLGKIHRLWKTIMIGLGNSKSV